MRLFLPLTFSVLLLFGSSHSSNGQSQLVQNLRAGKSQVLVVYGTSLTQGAGGMAWVDSIDRYFNGKYNHRLKVFNAAKGAMWSTWGVQELEDSVIAKRPDAVLIEFSMNDAFLPYHMTPALALLNLNYMIDCIQLHYPNCEIILQIMNLPVREHASARPRLADYETIYIRVAKKRKLLLINHHAYWKAILERGELEYRKYVPDGIHPSAESGRSLIAPFIIKTLEVAN